MKKPELHGFRIYRQETIPETFRRVVLEQLGQSLTLCDGYVVSPDYATHEIRKATKRIRAVYQLFRPATGKAAYNHGKDFYGSLSRLLAEHRLSAVYIESLQQLSSVQRLPVEPVFIEKLIDIQEKKHRQLTQKLIREHHIDHQLKELVLAESLKLKTDPLFSCEFTQIMKGLSGTYKRGRKSLDLAIQQNSTENIHDLRKKVKSLWNQMILLRPVWPATVTLNIHQLDLLSGKLGFEHDLAELVQYLNNEKPGSNDKQLALLLGWLSKKRLEVQKTLMPTALRLYAEKPRSLAGRMEEYYRIFLRMQRLWW